MPSKQKFYIFLNDNDKSFKDFSKKGKPNKNFVFFKSESQAMKHYFDNFHIDYRNNNENDLECFYLNGANIKDVELFYTKTNGKRFVLETYFGI